MIYWKGGPYNVKYCFHCMKEIGPDDSFCPHCRRETAFPAPEHHLLPGTVLLGKILIGTALGEGGFGITYIALDLENKRKIALKEYYPSGYVNRLNTSSQTVTCNHSEDRAEFFASGKKRFMSEARILSMFSREAGIVSVYDFFEANNTAYIAMEYLEGMDLKEYIKTHGTMSFENAVNMLLPLMYTLSGVHEKGLIHRDISPDNIRLVLGGVKLLDFGAARDISHESNKSLSVMLKPGYAPEEQYRTHGIQGPWTDIYALCATIYKCITGITPIECIERMIEDDLKKPSELGVVISERCEEALMKGLSVRAKDRYRTINDLLKDLLASGESDASIAEPRVLSKADTAPQSDKTTANEDDNRTVTISSAQNKAADDNRTITISSAAQIIGANDKAQSFGLSFTEGAEKIAGDEGLSPIIKETEEHIHCPGGRTKGKLPSKSAVIVSVISLILVSAVIIVYLTGGFNALFKKGPAEETVQIIEDPVPAVSVSAGSYHTAILLENGTVSAVGRNDYGQCDTDDWEDIFAVSTGDFHTVGLKGDGTVVAIGDNESGQCNTDDWKDIVAISTGAFHTVGLKRDGTVVAVGSNNDGQCNTDDWEYFSKISANNFQTVGVTSDNTVVAIGNNLLEQCNTDDWKDIVAVSAGRYHTVGLKKDGTVVAIGDNTSGQCSTAHWKDIIAVSAGDFHTVGLKKNGTVVAVGSNNDKQCDVYDWKGIVAVSSGGYNTVGIKKDGTVIAVGRNEYGQCDVDEE